MIFMQENNNKEVKKNQILKKINIKDMGIDIDKNEYHEIVLSNSNVPENDYIKRNYYD